MRYAESFGIRAARVREPAGLESAIREAIEAAVPALIEVPCGDMATPWPYIIRPAVHAGPATSG